MTEFRQSIVDLAELCAQKAVHEFIISPGSRSAPLALAFVRHPRLTCRAVVDERAAGFIALGLAQQTEGPVGLVCTSGTAGLNYGPAVAEAFYQNIPLLIFTADRPPEWLDQNDGQTIRQRELYGKHCRGFFELPVDDSHPDARWHIERSLSEAINASLWPVPGPVHINVPLREPLYPATQFSYRSDRTVISVAAVSSVLDEKDRERLLADWRSARKRLIVAGLGRPDAVPGDLLDEIQTRSDAVVLEDITANVNSAQRIQHADMILGSERAAVRAALTPDLLVTFGGPVVSRSLKLFLRQCRPAKHWHVQPAGVVPDTFQSLREIIPVAAGYFFRMLEERLPRADVSRGGAYRAAWQALESGAEQALRQFLGDFPDCELAAMAAILNALPQESHLQLGNSSIVRWANFLGLPASSLVKVNSNRGTNGIDGTVSTAVGAALACTRLTTLVVGDLAFFYDRNGLWHKHLPANLRIVVFNNRGGAIFRILDGARELPELSEYFEVEHDLTARATAREHGLGYTLCESVRDLEEALPEFFAPASQPRVLEVKFDKVMNARSFEKFKSVMREIG